MGTRSNSEGESSSGGYGDEVPPRKVRCTWQIQGKYCPWAVCGGDEDPEVTYLHMWQVKQLGRSYIDNLMNRALEDAQGVPYGNEGSVEDTAVLAAIHNHGLQVPRSCQYCPGVPAVSQPLEHTTFMDAAVTAAIQRKGLSSLSAADV